MNRSDDPKSLRTSLSDTEDQKRYGLFRRQYTGYLHRLTESATVKKCLSQRYIKAKSVRALQIAGREHIESMVVRLLHVKKKFLSADFQGKTDPDA
jgi:hypothetical protein